MKRQREEDNSDNDSHNDSHNEKVPSPASNSVLWSQSQHASDLSHIQPRAAKIVELDQASASASTGAGAGIGASSGSGSGSGSSSGSGSGLTRHDQFQCALHAIAAYFESYAEFEAHYHREHVNRCLACRKNLPSAHLLTIHIEECHDAFAAVKRDKGGRTYSCFVQDCPKKCSTPQKRRLHLIDKHMYPKNYFFAVTRDGIDRRHSLLTGSDSRPSHASNSNGNSNSNSNKNKSRAPKTRNPPAPLDGGSEEEKQPTAESPAEGQQSKDLNHKEGGRKDTDMADTMRGLGPDGPQIDAQVEAQAKKGTPAQPSERPDVVDMDRLTNSMSALQFIPTSVRFGRGRKSGFARR